MRLTFGKPASPSLYSKGDQVVYASRSGGEAHRRPDRHGPAADETRPAATYEIRFTDGYTCVAREFELKRAQ